MKWQEYQEAVARLYENSAGVGKVQRNVYIPDKDTEQVRQIDVLLSIETGTHQLNVVIDAKFRKDKLDVKDIEEVLALSNAVKACKAVIVAANGWTVPAEKKAASASLDLRVLSLEDALDLVVANKWCMCSGCERDCIILDQDGFIQFDDGTILWWLAGQCRSCCFGFVWCQDCGENLEIAVNTEQQCGCGYHWTFSNDGIGFSV